MTHQSKKTESSPDNNLAFTKDTFDFDNHLPYQLARTVNLIRQVTTPHYIEQAKRFVNISPREYRVIVIIASYGPISPADVADKTGMERSSVTRSCHGLKQLGLIETVKNSRDGRSKFLILTRDGAELCDELFPPMRARGECLDRALSKDEKATLISLLERLRQEATTLMNVPSQ